MPLSPLVAFCSAWPPAAITMGRYTTVQVYADNNTRVAPIPYEKATGAASGGDKTGDAASRAAGDAKPGAVRVPVVSNVYGSAAGVGSAGFHIYRNERRREGERLAAMEADYAEMSAEDAFRARVQANEASCAEATAKRAAARAKRKDKERAKRARKSETQLDGEHADSDDDASGSDSAKPTLAAATVAPLLAVRTASSGAELVSTRADTAAGGPLPPVVDNLLLNDGHFLERIAAVVGAPSTSTADASVREDAPAVRAPVSAAAADATCGAGRSDTPSVQTTST
ncbi:DUF1168 domain-containing protein, partial [archaeon]